MNNENRFTAKDVVIRGVQLPLTVVVNNLMDFPVLPREQIKRGFDPIRALRQMRRICSVVETAILVVTDGLGMIGSGNSMKITSLKRTK